MILLNTKNKSASVFCAGLAALVVVGCGKKTKTETIYQKDPSTTPAPGPVPVPVPVPAPTPAAPGDALAVNIKNRPAIEGKSLPAGPVTVEFGLEGAPTANEAVEFRCKLEGQNQGTGIAERCSSPKTFQVPGDGQYLLTVFAVHAESNVIGTPAEIPFRVGEQGAGQQLCVQGASVPNCVPSVPVNKQVGDLFTVTIPQGFHMVYRSSTFDIPGFLNYQLIDGGRAVDSSAPYAYRCDQSGQFQVLEPLMMPSGPLNYCSMTPSIAWNSDRDPIFNTFTWMTMGTMSYNSMLISSDASLAGVNPNIPTGPTLAKMYTTVFTQVAGRPADPRFATELSRTSSMLNLSCVGQEIEYLGNAPIFQGYFNMTVAAAPLFGCVRVGNGGYYVDIAAFPMDQNMPITQGGWSPWINQTFASTRAAEIVVEIGPFSYPPSPIGVAADAQALMVQNIRKLLPSPPQGPGPVFIPRGHRR